MKKCLIVSWVCTVMLCCKVFANTLDNIDVGNGLAELATNDLADANANFLAALSVNTNNQAANVLLAATRLLLVPQTAAGSNFLNGLYFSPDGRNVFDWTSRPTNDAFGGPIFPAGYNSTNIVWFFHTNINPLITASLANLANVTNTSLSIVLVVPEPDGNPATNTIDFGDVRLFQAGLYAADCLGDTLDANNASFILPQIVSFAENDSLTIQKVLATYPSLLTPHNTNALIPSEIALRDAAAFYFAGSDFIRNDRSPNDTNDLIMLDPNDVTNELEFRIGLSNVVSSLTAPTQYEPNDSYSIVNLGPYFSGTESVRKLLPQFNNNAYVNDTLPDYTFGGILPDEPVYRIEAGFRQEFAPFSGFYIGTVQDDLFNDSAAGSFMAFYNSSSQITIVGYDSDTITSSTLPGGFLLQVSGDAYGKWTINNSTVNGSGKVGGDRSFNGDLTYTNGDTIEFDNSYEIFPPGPYQSTSGYYTGSAKGTSNGHAISATINAILAPDGEFVFRSLDSGNNTDGGYNQFLNNNLNATTANGTTIAATLNPATVQITGTFNSSGGANGSFTLNRSASLPSDTPPTITSDLPAIVNLPLGNTVKFTVGATGSAPLSYRWFINGEPIVGAKSSTLVVSNNLWNSTGTYSISASVNNAVGEADSQTATVNVSNETNVPTVTITSPKPGQLWSNATFNVTGTASDKLGITSVYFYTNSGFFTLAATANNWANWNATATLEPGTNTISAIAYNVGGVAATNSVKVVYVQTAMLTVITNGLGSITPNDNGASLRLGTVYSLTGTGAPGYKLMSWKGGTNQPFSVYTNGPTVQFVMSNNLTMEANFVDTNQPLVKITNVPAGPGLVLSSNSYTVKGTATGVEAVGNVQYSLNGSAFTPASTSDNWTHWSDAPLSLQGGTNLFSAYATGTNGVNSATNTVRIFVISSNVLQLSISGKGTISPNYSNKWLNVGENYTMTATPAPGFVLGNWTGAISGSPLIPLTQKSTLTFLMQSNLILQANFVDTNKPFVKITNATTGLVLSSNTFTVMGTVTDDVAIASVNCSLNGNPVPGLGTNAITNGVSWSAPLSLAGGTNIFSIYAVATNGNISATNNLRIIFVSTNRLTLQVSGQGTVSPNYSNAWLRVGEAYTMMATPKPGWVSAGWSGSTNGEGGLVVLTNKPTVLFTMFSNLIMQANFVDTNKPFVKITNAPVGSVLTNEFTLMGTATDDVAIASVSYSLDGSPFTPVGVTSPINNGVSWSADLVLSPGTNKFAAYAVATNGNISATNNIIIIRQPAVALFPIATNDDLKAPQAKIAFDGTNYLVVFQGRSTNGGQATAQFVNQSGNLLGSALTLTPGGGNDPPGVAFDGANYLVAWADFSQAGVPVEGAFVSPGGVQGSPIQLSLSTTVDNFRTIVYGGGVYLVVWSDNSTSPDSLYGAVIDTSGNNLYGDFLISTNAQDDEAGQVGADFDGTNFLAVWSSSKGNTSIKGQLIDYTSGNLVGSPVLIYTNSTPAETAIPCVVFDGTKYLALFNVGVNSANASTFHILGRFVTTGGQVLTNQISLTSDAGPQIIAGAAFDGANYLVSWNQGFNPFAMNTSATINGRFLDPNGMPTSAEFPVFKTQGSLIPTWAPVLFDGNQFVLVGGLGKQIGKAPGNLTYTNGVIYGAFVSP